LKTKKIATPVAALSLASILVFAGCAPEEEPWVPLTCDGQSLTGLDIKAALSEEITVYGQVTGDQVTGPFRDHETTQVLVAVPGSAATFKLLDEAGEELDLTWGPITHIRKILVPEGTEYSFGINVEQMGCYTVEITNKEGVANVVFPVQQNFDYQTPTPTPGLEDESGDPATETPTP